MRAFHLPSSWFLAVGLLGALIGDASRAWACPAPCIYRLRTFANGAWIPGDLVYFKVLVDDPGALSLKTADGREIPASIRMIGPDRVYAPTDPIPANTLVVLTYPADSCDSATATTNYAFQTRAPLDTTPQAASLSASEYGLISGLPEFAMNANVGPIAFQRLIYAPPATAGGTPELIDIDVSVDGQKFFLYPMSWDSPIEVHGVCTSGPIPQPVGTCHETIYAPGHHTVTVQPHIVGQLDPPATSLDIDFALACGTGHAAPTPVAPLDAGMLDATVPAKPMDANPTACATEPAHADASLSTQAPTAPNAAGGCSATGRAPDSTVPWFVLLALGCLRLRAMRRPH